MALFIDTSALLALLDADAPRRTELEALWRSLLSSATRLETTNYVVTECMALAQQRLGLGAVRALETAFWPLLTVHWVGEEIHRAATSALLAADRKGLSLVDCVSFEVMRRRGLTRALSLDRDFERQGFELVPKVESGR